MNRDSVVMLRPTLFLCLALVSLGCGSSNTSASEPKAVARADAGPIARPVANVDAAATGTAPTADAGSAGLTADECTQFVNHAVAISLDAHNANTPAELRPTADQLAEIRKLLGAELAKACLALPRAGFQCAMAAKTKAEFLRCGGPSAHEGGVPTAKP